MIRFRCECGRELQADAARAGARGACPACRRTMTVPSSETAVARPARADDGAGGVCAGPKHNAPDLPPASGGTTWAEADNPFALADAAVVDDFSDEDRAVIRREAHRALFLGFVGLAVVVASPFAIYYGLSAL